MKTTREDKQITYKGIELIVEYNITLGDDQVSYYGDMSGYPGSDDEIEIKHIRVSDSNIDIYDLLEDNLEEIKELL